MSLQSKQISPPPLARFTSIFFGLCVWVCVYPPMLFFSNFIDQKVFFYIFNWRRSFFVSSLLFLSTFQLKLLHLSIPSPSSSAAAWHVQFFREARPSFSLLKIFSAIFVRSFFLSVCLSLYLITMTFQYQGKQQREMTSIIFILQSVCPSVCVSAAKESHPPVMLDFLSARHILLLLSSFAKKKMRFSHSCFFRFQICI